jgi:hypothetical protein
MLVDGNNVIAHYLKNRIPLAAGKIGVTELNILHDYINPKCIFEYLRHEVEDIAGLYPYTDETAKSFSDDMLDRLGDVDLIPQWSKQRPTFEQYVLDKYCPKAHRTLLQHLEPYYFDKPWTNYLEGKTVLVFSPFAESIERNFKDLDKIWGGKIKSNFNLKAVYYPFAIPINSEAKVKYDTSQKIYEEYLYILRNETFDVGIFGTGWTSLLFAVECKRLDKVGIHLGGATQILFGVRGQRWREIKEVNTFFNEYWTDPLDREKPDLRHLVEGGCYW